MEQEINLQEENKPKVFNPFGDVSLTMGDLGSLSEMMGEKEAEEYLDANSLTRHTQKEAARRRGRPIIRSYTGIKM